MSDDEEVGTNSIGRSTHSPSEEPDDVIYDDMSLEESTQASQYTILNKCDLDMPQNPLPPLLPKIRPNSLLPRNLSLPDLEKNKLPVVIEVIEGICDEDDRNSIFSEDKLVVLSRANSGFVTCINTKEQVFNIPIILSYQIALMSSDTKLKGKQKETIKSILDMKDIPSQIIANTDFEIDGVSMVEGQILEVSEKQERNPKYLRILTLSGEEVELPRSLKNTFSCSISSDNMPLPLAIESCVFPQQVVLTDKSCNGRTRKMLCTILDSFTDTFFKVCQYKGDLASSFKSDNPIQQIPIDIGITFKIINKPSQRPPPSNKPDLDQRQLKTTARVMGPEKVPPPTPMKPRRSSSFSSLSNTKVRVSKEIGNPQKNGSLRRQKTSGHERNCMTPPLVKEKPFKPPKGKIDKKAMTYELRNISLENVTNFEDIGPSKVTATKENKNSKTPKGKGNNELAEENKQLKETISSLESSLSEKEREVIELKLKLDLLENALSEANTSLSMEMKRNIQLEMRERSLPPIPGQGSTPTTPASPVAQFPAKPSPPPPSMTAKPKLDLKQKSNVVYIGLEEPEEEKHTMHYLGTVLDKMNLSQYKETFFEHGINMEIFLELDEEVLQNELGVKAVLHRKKLMRLAVRMKNNEDISHFFVDPQYTHVTAKKKKKNYEYM